jgi:hypothetical protein
VGRPFIEDLVTSVVLSRTNDTEHMWIQFGMQSNKNVKGHSRSYTECQEDQHTYVTLVRESVLCRTACELQMPQITL